MKKKLEMKKLFLSRSPQKIKEIKTTNFGSFNKFYNLKTYIFPKIYLLYQSLHSTVDKCLKANEKLTLIDWERDQNSTIDQKIFI
jgi:hypothetical protein